VEELVDRKRMKTGIRSNDGYSSEIGVNRFGKTRTTSARRTVARAEMHDMRIGMVTHAIPKNLIFFMIKCKFIHWVIMSQRTLTNGNWEFIKNHVVPILPIQRRSVGAVAKTNARNMQLRDIPRNTPEGEPETGGGGRWGWRMR
jgi:hypothetical protein